jgi:hypothetical protein
MKRGLIYIAACFFMTGLAWAEDAEEEAALPPEAAEAPRVAEVLDSAPTASSPAASEAPNDSLLLDIGEVLDDFLTPDPYYYQGSGTRDPFLSLLQDPDRTPADGLIEVDDLIVVGVLWGAKDRFALAQTSDGRSMILREGDRISNGRVVTIRLDSITVRVSHYGVVKMVTIPVTSGVEENDDR